VKIDSAGTAALSWGARTLAGGDARLYAAIQRSGGDPVVTRIAGAGYDGGPGAEIDEHGRSVFTWIAAHHIHTMRGHFAP
jgi:hypothetical protein